MILAVGALDSSGGAGLDRDRRTAESLGVPLRSAVTGVTAQGREGVLCIHPVPTDILRTQLETHWGEDRPSVVKVGALCDPRQIGLLSETFARWKRVRPELIIVADPVFAPTRGLPFLEEAALSDYASLLDACDVVTPNRGELERLTGFPLISPALGIKAARELAGRHGLAVILKGGHFEGPLIEEYVVTERETFRYLKPRMRLRRTHGTGCCLASALAVYLSRGLSLPRAFPRATRFVTGEMNKRIPGEISPGEDPSP